MSEENFDNMINSMQNESTDQNDQSKAYFIGDGGTNRFKISKDAIVYNGESLGDENGYVASNNCSQNCGDYSLDSTPAKVFGVQQKSHSDQTQSQ